MTLFLALIVCATAGAEPEDSGLEEAFRQGGAAGFLAAVRELEQEQGSEHTAKALVRLTSGRDGDRELRATAAHAIGQMGEVGKTVLPELAEALYRGFPADRLNELGAGDIPLWLAEVLLRPDDPSFYTAGRVLATKLDLKNEERLLPLLIQAAGQTQAYPEILQRAWAIRALGKMGDTAASSRPLLVDLLKKEDAEPDDNPYLSDKDAWNYVRGYTAWALAEIGAEPESTAELFTGMLDHPDQVIRDWCALGLALLDRKQNPARAAKTLVELLSASDGWDQDLRAVIVHTIGRMGEAGKAVLPELAEALWDNGLPIMWYVHGEYDLGDIPLWYAEALLRPEDPAFEHVGFHLGMMVGPEQQERLLPLLLQGARHANPEVRYWAVGALGDMGETAAPACPLLVEILKKEPPGDLTPSDVTRWNDIRGQAAFSLGQIGAEPESTVQLLTEMLGHPNKDIWTRSASGLGRMRGKAAPAIPALVETLGRDYYTRYTWSARVNHVAAAALCNIGEPAIPALIEVLQSERPVVRRRAANALSWSAHLKLALGPVIKAATEDDDRHVRLTAIQALNRRSSSFQDDARLLPAAIRLLEDTSPKVRACSVHLLGQWDRPEEVPLPPVVDLLNDPNVKVRLAAIEAVFRLSPQAEEIGPALERVLNDPDRNVRSSAQRLRDRIRAGKE